jgi:hypothetical protein
MHSTARKITSATIGLGLASLSVAFAFTIGVQAPATVLTFALLAIYGLAEIAIVSYAPRRSVLDGVRARRVHVAAVRRTRVRIPALVEYAHANHGHSRAA